MISEFILWIYTRKILSKETEKEMRKIVFLIQRLIEITELII